MSTASDQQSGRISATQGGRQSLAWLVARNALIALLALSVGFVLLPAQPADATRGNLLDPRSLPKASKDFDSAIADDVRVKRQGIRSKKSAVLSTTVSQVSPARVAGRGLALVSTPRMRPGSVRKLRLTVRGSRGATIEKLNGKRWSCTRGSAPVCSHPRFKTRAKVAPLKVQFGAKKATRRGGSIIVQARWQSRVGKSWRTHLDRARTNVDVYPKMRMQLPRPSRSFYVTSKRNRFMREVAVSATVRGTKGQPATIRWQVPSGVKLLTPRRVSVGDGTVTAKLLLPVLKKTSKKRSFKVSVTSRSLGASVKRATKIVAIPEKTRRLRGKVPSAVQSRLESLGRLGARSYRTTPRDSDTISIKLNDSELGPKELSLTDIYLVLAPDAADSPCSATATKSVNLKDLTYAIRANARVLGARVAVQGQIGPSGYCFSGESTRISLGGQNGPTLSNAKVAYSSFATDMSFADGTEWSISAGELAVGGTLALGSVVSSVLPVLGGSTTFRGTVFTAASENVGLVGSARYELPDTSIVTSNTGDISISGTSTVDLVYVPGEEAKLRFAAAGDLSTAGSSDGSVDASTTPLAVQVFFNASKQGAKFVAGLDDSRVGSSVSNAFGVSGLSLSELSLGAVLSSSEAAVSLTASGSLPKTWTAATGIDSSAQVDFMARLARDDSSCLRASIGDEEGSQTVLDLANAGVVTARYVNLFVAPQGCQAVLPSGASKTIDPGFVFGLRGSVAGSNIDLIGRAELPATQVGREGFSFSGDVALPSSWTVGGVTVSNGQVSFEIDTQANTFDVDITGDLDFLGNTVAVDFSLRASGQNVVLEAAGRADISMGKLRMAGDYFHRVTADRESWAISAVSSGWKGDIRVLGVGIPVTIWADYVDGAISNATGSTEVDLSLYDYSLTGTITLAYDAGQDGKTITLGMTGSYDILWWADDEFDVQLLKIDL